MAMREAGSGDSGTPGLPATGDASMEGAASSIAEPAPPEGDLPPSVEEILREALPLVLAMARSKGFDEEGQREIAQEVGAILVEKIGEYSPRRGRPRMWAAGIARRVILDARRARRVDRRRAVPAESLSHRPALGLTPEESLRARAALAVINATLTEECREICELTAEGFTAAEIGELTGLPASTVEFRLKQARVDLERALKKMGEDRESAVRVRGMLVPFATVDELERALRTARTRGDVAAELVKRVARRGIGLASSPSLDLARVGGRVVMSLGRFVASSTAVFVAGAVTGAAVYATLAAPASESRPSIAADPAPATPVSAVAAPTAAVTAAPVTPAATALSPSTAMTAAATPTSTPDPAAMGESMLLQMAITAPPARSLALADLHAQRFRTQNVEKRELIIVRALVALGRRTEAEAHARALRGTVYEAAVEDALGSSKK